MALFVLNAVAFAQEESDEETEVEAEGFEELDADSEEPAVALEAGEDISWMLNTAAPDPDEAYFEMEALAENASLEATYGT